MGSVTHFWNLKNPKSARDFLRDIRIGPQCARITYVKVESGEQIQLKDATDEQIVVFAEQIAEMIGYGAKRESGKGE